jgi:hypothetical protein
LLRHLVRRACSLAEASAGSKSAARIAMMAMTTNSSINVNARNGDMPVAFPRTAVASRVRIRFMFIRLSLQLSVTLPCRTADGVHNFFLDNRSVADIVRQANKLRS